MLDRTFVCRVPGKHGGFDELRWDSDELAGLVAAEIVDHDDELIGIIPNGPNYSSTWCSRSGQLWWPVASEPPQRQAVRRDRERWPRLSLRSQNQTKTQQCH